MLIMVFRNFSGVGGGLEVMLGMVLGISSVKRASLLARLVMALRAISGVGGFLGLMLGMEFRVWPMLIMVLSISTGVGGGLDSMLIMVF